MPDDSSRALEEVLREVRDRRVRSRLLELIVDASSRLARGEVDVVVLSARRMACLYALLSQHGLKQPDRGVVVSDRFMELVAGSDWWRGRRVLVLDDSVISGRTLSERLQRVRHLIGTDGSIEVEVVVGTIEGQHSLPVALGTTPVMLNRAEVSELNRDYSRVFSNNLVPYFADYPITNAFTMLNTDLEALLNSDSWTCVDVTNAAVAGTAAHTYSLLPGPSATKALQNSLGSLLENVEICKIRLFTSDAGFETDVRLVPIVALGAVDKGQVKRLAESFGIGQCDPGQVLGLLSFAASSKLLALFLRIHSLVTSCDETISSIMLGSEAIGDTRRVISGFEDAFPNLNISAPKQWNGELPSFLPRWQRRTFADAGETVVLGDDITLPVYRRLSEIPQTEHEANSSLVALPQEAYAHGSSASTLSLAIDVLNDLGYAVPEYSNGGSSVVRSYRIGESAGGDLIEGRLGGSLASISSTLIVDSGGSSRMLANIKDDQD